MGGAVDKTHWPSTERHPRNSRKPGRSILTRPRFAVDHRKSASLSSQMLLQSLSLFLSLPRASNRVTPASISQCKPRACNQHAATAMTHELCSITPSALDMIVLHVEARRCRWEYVVSTDHVDARYTIGIRGRSRGRSRYILTVGMLICASRSRTTDRLGCR